jgi:hypothetical protein
MRIDRYNRDGHLGESTDNPVALLVTSFERAGAQFTITADGDLRTALDGMGPPPRYADGLVAALMMLSEPIKDFLTLRAAQGTIQ